jgi:hypothetical protein
MSRKRIFGIYSKPRKLIPNKISNIIKNYRRPALMNSTIAEMENWGFIPLWDHGDLQTRKKSKNFLLKLPIFKKTRSGEIVLRDVQHERAICKPTEANLLLYGLSGELCNFYLARNSRINYDLESVKKVVDSFVDSMKTLRDELITLRVVKKNLVDKTFDRLVRWLKQWLKKCLPMILSPPETGELESSLYPYFKGIIARISDAEIYTCLAYILKSLGIERGEIKQISERIKKRLIRRGNKTKLDIDRLQKTKSKLG